MHSPRPVAYFTPTRIVLAKGSTNTEDRRRMVEGVCRVYPDAEVVEASDTPHNKVRIDHQGMLDLHAEGKRTLVLAEHSSAVRFSSESGNCCPNYWHFSPYGFCPYGCHYCYLAGTKGVQPSPTVKLFLNLDEILARIGQVAKDLTEPAAFYCGKLQDGLALDPLCGYSRQIVPFFARQKHAYLTLLTKSADVSNLLDLDHRRRSILSWTVSPPEVAQDYEPGTPPVDERLEAMKKCAAAGYPVRAVVMPILPLPECESVYGDFLRRLVSEVPLTRITLGSICSYPGAARLTALKLGTSNLISCSLAGREDRLSDGRLRFPYDRRMRIYRHLVGVLRKTSPDLKTSLCLEEGRMFDSLGIGGHRGRCNCVV